MGRVWGLLHSWQLESANRGGGRRSGGERGGGEGGRGREREGELTRSWQLQRRYQVREGLRTQIQLNRHWWGGGGVREGGAI